MQSKCDNRIIATSHKFGHPVEFVDNGWRYKDTQAALTNQRKCPICKDKALESGEDPCLGSLKNVTAACCGHGELKDAYVKLESGERLDGQNAVNYFKNHHPSFSTVSPDNPLIIYAIYKSNINMTSPKLAAQVAHAVRGLNIAPEKAIIIRVLAARLAKFNEYKSKYPKGFTQVDQGLTEVETGTETVHAYIDV